MKKQLLGLMTILTVLGACQKNEVLSLSEDITIHAAIEDKDATRTVMDENNNIIWSENDQIIAFMKSSYGHKYQVKPSFVGKSHADFSMVSSSNNSDLSAGNEWEHNVVYYPYSENIECLKSGSNYALEVNLPSEQLYAPDSFANGSMAMVAVSENNNITFKNVLGGIKLQLKGTQKVAKINVEGKNNEKLSGAAVVTAYIDETKPAINMASSASVSVCLTCGTGVQLNEARATNFIIALPPVLFSCGFSITITDIEGKIYTIATDKPNTVLRSSLLVMPTVKVGDLPDNDQTIDEIPVNAIDFNYTNMTIPPMVEYTLSTKIIPIDASNQSLTWSSSCSSIASVDQTGTITSLSDGVTTITAVANNGIYKTCTVTVISMADANVDYEDEYNVNHGKGISLGNIVWAPVNCGYHETEYPYGKLYQWGRKHGQGYGKNYDSHAPTISEGPVSIVSVKKEESNNTFYTSKTGDWDWLSPSNDELWNNGTDENPIKTEFDPCPTGWRVPTKGELEELLSNHSLISPLTDKVKGMWFSGIYTYLECVPHFFLLAAGYREGYDGNLYNVSYQSSLYSGNYCGYYWSSSLENQYNLPYFMDFEYRNNYYGIGRVERSRGYSIRCVQE